MAVNARQLGDSRRTVTSALFALLMKVGAAEAKRGSARERMD